MTEISYMYFLTVSNVVTHSQRPSCCPGRLHVLSRHRPTYLGFSLERIDVLFFQQRYAWESWLDPRYKTSFSTQITFFSTLMPPRARLHIPTRVHLHRIIQRQNQVYRAAAWPFLKGHQTLLDSSRLESDIYNLSDKHPSLGGFMDKKWSRS